MHAVLHHCSTIQNKGFIFVNKVVEVEQIREPAAMGRVAGGLSWEQVIHSVVVLFHSHL